MIVTFYSYKGGVGRSLALAHVAEALAQRGLRVLAVDFDLEAPGLEWYFHGADGGRERRRYPGLIDLIVKFREAFSSEAAFERGEYKRLQSFIMPALDKVAPPRGAVDLMTAGCREPADKLRDYALTVRNFDWQDFFFNWKGELFFDWLRRRWTANPDPDPDSGTGQEAGYDIVLVDSRTGVTEMGGICAYQLADAVVMLCAPNYQNLEGTRDVARDFASPGVRALRRDRPLQTLVVPARLVAEHPRREQFLQDFERELGREGLPLVLREAGLGYQDLALHYDPALSIGEGSIGHGPAPADSRFAAEIARLADALLLMAPADGPLQAARSAARERLGSKAKAVTGALQADTRRASAGWDVFIECGLEDVDAAAAIARRLTDSGLQVFMPGAEEALAQDADAIGRALAYSAHLLLCFGRTSGSLWRDGVLVQARRHADLRLLPLLLPGSQPEALRGQGLDRLTAFDLRAGVTDKDLARLALQLRSVGPADPPPATAARAPYPGARAFDEGDQQHLRGREPEIAELHQQVLLHACVELVGPAQVGKTSLVLAGLLPRLRLQAQFHAMHVVDAAAVTWPTPPAADGKRRQLIVIDGLASFDADRPSTDATSQFDRLARLAGSAGAPLHLLVVWRGTGLGGRLPSGRLPWQRVTCNPLSAQALREAIEAPARIAGHLLENGLVERLVEGAGTARSAIAQIQRVMARLWEMRRRGWIDNRSLDAIGTVGGEFQQHLVQTLLPFGPDERLAAADLFRALVVVEAEKAPWRGRTLRWAELATMPSLAKVDALGLRDRLARAGLVDLWADAGSDTLLALVRPDPRAYFNDAASASDEPWLRWRHRLGLQAAEWQAQRQAREWLLAGDALVEAGRRLAAHADALTEAERQFIARSRAEYLVEMPGQAGDAGVTVTAVPGQDVVALHLADGPTLMLHPETARDLMLAQSGSRREGQKSARSAVPVPPGFLGGVLLKAFDVLSGVAEGEDAVRRALERVDPVPAAGLRPLGRAQVTEPGATPPAKGVAPRESWLVLIPGLMLDAETTFGALWRDHPAAVARLLDRFAGRAFAFAHHSLLDDPIISAIQLAEACPRGARLVLLSHGTGGLVAEALVRAAAGPADEPDRIPASLRDPVQHLTGLLQRRRLQVLRTVRVACPVRGTLLASSRLDAYLSVFHFALQQAGGQVSPAMVDLLAAVARHRLDPATVPGFAACLPDSPLLAWLNGGSVASPSRLFVVAGDTAGSPMQSWLKALVSDAHYWTDNDLIVQTRSMYGGVPRADGGRFLLVQDDKIQHFGYFAHPRAALAIVDALLDDTPKSFQPIGALQWAGQTSGAAPTPLAWVGQAAGTSR